MLKLSSPMAERRLALLGCHQSMPTRRTPIDRGRRVQITPAMVVLWKRGQEILATNAEQKWEEEGGRRREFLDLAVELHELLDSRQWDVDVLTRMPLSQATTKAKAKASGAARG